MKLGVLLNSTAGRGSEQVELLRRAVGRSCDLRCCGCGQETVEAARQAVESGFSRLVIAGGDGTLSIVVNALGERLSEVELALIPLGTANDFARSLDVPRDDPAEALELALSGVARPLDIVRVSNGGDFYLVNAATGGFGGEVTAHVSSADKQRWGAFAYWMSAMARIVDLHEHRVHLDLDTEQVDKTVFALALANGRYVGGGFPIAPAARLNDGYLEVTLVPALPAMELLAAGVNFALGRDEHPPRLLTYRSRKVHIKSEPRMLFSVDGEPQRAMEASFEVLPGALRCVVGSEPALDLA